MQPLDHENDANIQHYMNERFVCRRDDLMGELHFKIHIMVISAGAYHSLKNCAFSCNTTKNKPDTETSVIQGIQCKFLCRMTHNETNVAARSMLHPRERR